MVIYQHRTERKLDRQPLLLRAPRSIPTRLKQHPQQKPSLHPKSYQPFVHPMPLVHSPAPAGPHLSGAVSYTHLIIGCIIIFSMGLSPIIQLYFLFKSYIKKFQSYLYMWSFILTMMQYPFIHALHIISAHPKHLYVCLLDTSPTISSNAASEPSGVVY